MPKRLNWRMYPTRRTIKRIMVRTVNNSVSEGGVYLHVLQVKQSLQPIDGSLSMFAFCTVPSSEFSNKIACERLANVSIDDSSSAQTIFSVAGEIQYPVPIQDRGLPESQKIKLIRCGSFVHVDNISSVMAPAHPAGNFFSMFSFFSG